MASPPAGAAGTWTTSSGWAYNEGAAAAKLQQLSPGNTLCVRGCLLMGAPASAREGLLKANSPNYGRPGYESPAAPNYSAPPGFRSTDFLVSKGAHPATAKRARVA